MAFSCENYVTVKELNAIKASSGSDVKSGNTIKGETLKVKASNGVDFRYYGNPNVKGTDESSGGNVRGK